MTLLGQTTLRARAPGTPFGPPPREVYDLVTTSGSAVVTSATAAFTSTDVGALIAGLNIPFGSTIASVQSATQATMSANAAATFSGTTATIGSLSSATPVGVGVPRTPGRVVNVIGDSIAPQQAGQTGGAAVGFMGSDGSKTNSLLWAHLLSDGQIIPGKQAGIGSQRIDHMLQRLYNDVLPHPAQFCMIQTGTNDASFGHSPAAWASYLRAMCAALLAAGQTPVLVAGPPVPSSSRVAVDRYRRFVTAFALRNGFPLVDAYSALADTTGVGGYAAALDSGDGVHPGAAGARAYGQAIVDALAGHLQPGKPTLQRTNSGASTASLIDNGLFLTDTNADGVPDGWTKSGAGGGQANIVTGDSGIAGNALRLVDAANSGTTTLTYPTSTTVPAGARYAFTGRIKVDGPGVFRFFAYLASQFPGGTRIAYDLSGVPAATGGWKRFYLEGINATGAARTATVELSSTGAVDTDVSIAQIAIHDLTAAGL